MMRSSRTRVVITGALGQVGRAINHAAPPEAEVTALSRLQLDIADRRTVRAVLEEVRPDWVINSAAFTDVDRAEAEQDEAHRVNAVAPAGLAVECRRLAIGILHFGSDYIFDGESTRPYREDDTPRPLSAYGRSKLAGELALRRSGVRHLIVRTQWVYGPTGRCFPLTMWERASRGELTSVVGDQHGRPTSATDLALACWRLLGHEGVLHVANEGTASWYDVAQLIFAEAGRPDLLSMCTTRELGRPAPRPHYSVLDTTRARTLLGGPLPDWRVSLRDYVRTLPRAGSVSAR